MKDMTKPYDAKKDCWVPDEAEGFKLGEISKEEGDMVEVMIDCMPKKFKKDVVKPVNPPKFEKAVDVSDLTYLNDASVLYNLKARYVCRLMYTYSGLFCIAVNPYKRYPIYTERAAKIYMGKRRNEVPPHVFAISENAYSNMRQTNMNQSMLITGESGAGKTENTKKVITYFGYVGATGAKLKPGEKAKDSLEDQIVATNPVLEAFGNAKTTRNDNSSRFGKFIKIHFQPNGKLAGADIENYILEKVRVIEQAAAERGYHIFYNIMTDHVDYLKKMCHLSNDIYDYPWQSKGKTTVPSIDDREDMEYAHNSFTMLLFPDQVRDDIYKITAICMHCGNMKFKQRGREEQAEPDGDEAALKVADLSGVDCPQMLTNYCKPKIRVGGDLLVKGQTVEKAADSVGAMAKGLFDRLFTFLVKKCNETLFTGLKCASFIGVLDIAGFEIFEHNGFEQICINFCNEKLQQFFNHHMFVLEQEEYKKEEIQWVFIDFGMDLAVCIELFEKPMGILSILEEESMFPKATDKSFAEKLTANCLGKSVSFQKPKGNAHMGINHYAGCVNYNITGWLEKNKDPLNDTVIDQLKKGTNELLVELFASHPGQSAPPEEKGAKGGKGGKKKSGGFKTVSSGYREQLNSLLTTLNSTEPHFIRCIVPNETKSPGVCTADLIMHQLTCNGVLEGIRICQLGLPNRMIYSDFKQRYKILGAQFFAKMDDKLAVKATFDDVGLDAEKYRVGKTKVFFRAGVLGEVEEIRDDVIGAMVKGVQNWVRGYLGRRKYKILQEQRVALSIVQRNVRKYMGMKQWRWFYVWMRVKPLIGKPRLENAIEEIKAQSEAAVAACKEAEQKAEKLENEHGSLIKEIEKLKVEVEETGSNVSQYLEKQQLLLASKQELETQLQDTQKRFEATQDAKNKLMAQKKSTEGDVGNIQRDLEDLDMNIQRAVHDRDNQDHQIRNLEDELDRQEEVINKINKEKRQLQEVNAKNSDVFADVEDKAGQLNKMKQKLEQTVEEIAETINREKKGRNDIEKSTRKVVADIKLTQEQITDLERNRKDLEGLIFKKDQEYQNMAAKCEDEQGNAGKVQKNIRELTGKIEEMEDEIKNEAMARAKAEHTNKKLERDMEELNDRLEETGGSAQAQADLNKKREHEAEKIKREVEETKIIQDQALATLRKKHNDSVAELSEQLDHLNKMKLKTEKEKDGLRKDADESKAAMDGVSREKAAAEKVTKTIQVQMKEIQNKMDEANRNLTDFGVSKQKLTMESSEIVRQLEEVDAQNSQLSKLTVTLGAQLDDVTKLAGDENRERTTLLGKYRNLEHDLDNTKQQYQEEAETKDDLYRNLQRADQEANMYRARFETDGMAKADEIEADRLKLSARLDETEQQIEQLTFKHNNYEKIKARLASELDSVRMDNDRASAAAATAEKKQVSFDKIIGDYKAKCDDLTNDVSMSMLESRNISAELFRATTMFNEGVASLDDIKRENRQSGDEIKELLGQIGESSNNMHSVTIGVKKLELEKDEMTAALEEAEIAVENEENKTLRIQLELSAVKAEIDLRVAQKEEEFSSTRRGHQKALENVQASLENELKSKSEALRQKAKLDSDIQQLHISIDHSDKANGDIQKTVKKLNFEIKELQDKALEEQHIASEYREQCASEERKSNALYGEVEEARTLLEQAERGKRQAESDLSEINGNLTLLTNQNGSLSAAKRKLESEYATVHTEIDDMALEVRNSESKAKHAMADAARLADELRAEQQLCHTAGTSKKNLEAGTKDLQLKLEESESVAVRSAKRAVQKLESKVFEYEGQYDEEARRHVDAQKNLRRAERKIKELTFLSDENKKGHERMSAVVDSMQGQIKAGQKQLDDAEHAAAVNLAKYKKITG